MPRQSNSSIDIEIQSLVTSPARLPEGEAITTIIFCEETEAPHNSCMSDYPNKCC